MQQLKELITEHITEFIKNYRNITTTVTTWGSPLVGFASAKDKIFTALKENNPEHLLPTDLLKNSQTVIAYFIPFAETIVQSNVESKLSSLEWAKAYIETNQLIVDLNKSLADKMTELGYNSAMMAPTHNFDQEALRSAWSHKHVCYIAGLGTFGLHQMLITSKGCCGRVGSFITDAVIEPTPRPTQEYCHYKINQTCKACVNNCPVGALATEAFDRHLCYKLCLKNAAHYKNEGLADVCGKCMTMVPCSFRKPN